VTAALRKKRARRKRKASPSAVTISVPTVTVEQTKKPNGINPTVTVDRNVAHHLEGCEDQFEQLQQFKAAIAIVPDRGVVITKIARRKPPAKRKPQDERWVQQTASWVMNCLPRDHPEEAEAILAMVHRMIEVEDRDRLAGAAQIVLLLPPKLKDAKAVLALVRDLIDERAKAA
jgi:hypothetical protein